MLTSSRNEVYFDQYSHVLEKRKFLISKYISQNGTCIVCFKRCESQKKLYRAVPFFLKPHFFNSPFIKEVMPHRLYTQDITKAFLKNAP